MSGERPKETKKKKHKSEKKSKSKSKKKRKRDSSDESGRSFSYGPRSLGALQTKARATVWYRGAL